MAKAKSKNTFNRLMKEWLMIITLFVVVSIASDVYTNFSVFSTRFTELLAGSAQAAAKEQSLIDQYSDEAMVQSLSLNQLVQRDQYIDNTVQDYLLQASDMGLSEQSSDLTLESSLKAKKEQYSPLFNKLPPTSRIIVPGMGIDVPLVEWQKTYTELMAGDFDQELYEGVVRYPTTSLPGYDGNVFLFGHTSYDYYKKNPYGDVFKNITKLKEGEIIKIVREWHLYKYEVQEIVVVTPEKVKDVYLKYQDGKYLTLMGCYPIGTTKDRILAIAKQIN